MLFFFKVMEMVPFITRREYVRESITQQTMMLPRTSESENIFTIKDALFFMLGFCFGMLFIILLNPRY